MSKIKLIFGTCNAVPSGETEFQFENAYQKAFKPFITAIYNHPEILSTLYYAGPLLEWLEKKHPEFHTVLGELISRKNIEILGGGYWEPMLPLIPTPDKVGQIEVMTTYLRKKFGKRSHGGWIPGQIWEMHLASSLRASGMDYVFLSEQAFPRVSEFRPDAPVIAENQGKTILVFPIMESLTSQFLKIPPEHIVDKLGKLETGRDREVVVTLILDGLTLGADGRHTVCYEEKWLERFFDAVVGAKNWLECVHPGRYLRNTDLPRRKLYIPAPTYDALMQWSRESQPDRNKPGVADVSDSLSGAEIGNSFRDRPKASYRDFLAIYRESGFLYAKMMHVEVLSNQLRGDKYRKKNAKEELWRGQEHYAYWHGPNGGIYDSRLRHSAYSALIEAEKATRERGIFKAALVSVDFDMDGNKEYLYNGLNFNAYVHPVGGVLFELDYLPVSRNYLATFSKHRENYHPRGTVERGYDSYPRHAFLDHILDPGEKLTDFERGSHRKLSELPGKQYRTLDLERDPPSVSLGCNALLDGNEALGIRKTFSFRRGSLMVQYTLSNLSRGKLTFLWGSEINLALSDDAEMRSVFLNVDEPVAGGVQERGSGEEVDSWSVLDRERGVMMDFQLSETAELWRFPVFVDYRAGGGLRRTYQSNFFMPRWLIDLEFNSAKSLGITMKIGRHRSR